jgi:PAS domain S-box-containing protein
VYVFVFVSGAAFLVGITAYSISGAYRNARSSWAARLSREVTNRDWILRTWLLEARSDSLALASFPLIQKLLSPHQTIDAPSLPPSAELKLVLTLLDEYKTVYGYSSVHVLDTAGHVVAETTESASLNLQLANLCRAVSRTGKYQINLLGEKPENSLIVFAKPITADERGANQPSHFPKRVLGVVMLVDRLADEVFPPLTLDPVRTRTGETLLLRVEGGKVVYFSPRRNSSAGSATIVGSRDTLKRVIAQAVEDRPTFGEFIDYRGVPVMASLVKFPLLSGVLVSKIDCKEALADFYHTAELEGVLAGAAVILYGGLLFGYRRSLLAHEMKERLAQQSAILKLKEYAQQIVDSVPSGLLVLSSDCRVLSTSRSFLDAFHLRNEHVIGRALQDVVQIESLPLGDAEALRREVYPRIVQIRLKEGDKTTCPARVAVVGLASAEKDGRLLFMVEDLTETERLRATQEVLSQRLRELVQTLDAVVWEADASTLQLTFVSQKGEEILGYPAESWLKEPAFWGKHIHPDDREVAISQCRAAVDGDANRSLEYRVIAADGQILWLRDELTLVRDDDGKAREFRGVMVDITDQKRAEEQIKKLNEDLVRRASDLENINRELDAFTYSVSHDLRAPLRHIDGFSRILVEKLASELPQPVRRHLERIQQGTQRMKTLIDDLLRLGQLGRKDLTRQLTDLNVLVEEVLQELKPETEGRQIEWQIGQLSPAYCDRGLIKQVFVNLLSNAIKYTRPRHKAIIQVGQMTAETQSVIFVRDNGVGFNMEYSKKLFGAFQRLHKAEDFEGTGVGLATVQRIIHRHRGRVWAEAELDKGACFSFTLGELADTPAVATRYALG